MHSLTTLVYCVGDASEHCVTRLTRMGLIVLILLLYTFILGRLSSKPAFRLEYLPDRRASVQHMQIFISGAYNRQTDGHAILSCETWHV